MAFPTAVNDQITDSVTQTSLQVLGTSAPMALAFYQQASALALAHAAHNATNAQQLANILAQAVTARCVKDLGTAGVVTPVGV